MSNKLLNKVRDAEIGSATAKEVLKVIADQANDDGTGVWSSIGYFMYCTERSRTAVKTAIAHLRKNGFISHKQFTKSGTHEWKVNISALDKVQRDWNASTQEDVEVVSRPGLETTEGEALDDQGEVVSRPQTPNNPNINLCPKCEQKTTRIHATTGRPLYCETCIDLQTKKCERCGENKIERTPEKRRMELCHDCGIIIDGMYEHMAVRSLKHRKHQNLPFTTVEKLVEVVGDDINEQRRWAQYLDYWKSAGWNLYGAGVANVLDAFRKGDLNSKVGAEGIAPTQRMKRKVRIMDYGGKNE